ncbi:hypothetical protein CDD83_4923 [Cordyceps sp. RAO-2017]|nr:hypothetical protein CDD83_4923 [Cordyceps sp. RAO-2017]
MKFAYCFIVAIAAISGSTAVDQKKSAIVSFDDPATPEAIVDRVKEDLVKAGGRITHEYNLIKGFAVVAPGKALENAQLLTDTYRMRIEEDETVNSQ